MIFKNPGAPGALVNFKTRYENYIGGQWVPPVTGDYFDNISPVDGSLICQILGQPPRRLSENRLPYCGGSKLV